MSDGPGKDERDTVVIDTFGPADIEPARKLYNVYVRDTTATFQEDPVEADEFGEMMFHADRRHRAFAIREGGRLVGYCLAAPYKSRCAYRSASEVAVYLDPDVTGRGLGTRALQVLERHGREVGLHVLIAGVCTENEASCRLFLGAGYAECALFREVGQKFGRRLDVKYFQKVLGDASPG